MPLSCFLVEVEDLLLLRSDFATAELTSPWVFQTQIGPDWFACAKQSPRAGVWYGSVEIVEAHRRVSYASVGTAEAHRRFIYLLCSHKLCSNTWPLGLSSIHLAAPSLRPGSARLVGPSLRLALLSWVQLARFQLDSASLGLARLGFGSRRSSTRLRLAWLG